MNIVKDIRESVKLANTHAEFSYGRKWDTALEALIKVTKDSFVCLDPVTYVGTVNDNTETASISIAFLKKDVKESVYDKDSNEAEEESMEEIINDCKQQAQTWLSYFNDNYELYQMLQYTMFPVHKIKDVCTGINVAFQIQYNKGC